MRKSLDKLEVKNSFKLKMRSLISKVFFQNYFKNKKNSKSCNNIAQGLSSSLNSNTEMVGNLSNFSKKTVLDVMIPRSDIISASDDINIEELSDLIIKHSHTRTLIYKGSLDNIIGFVHIKDLFGVLAHTKKFSLKKVIRKHIISPDSMKIVDLFTQMKSERTHIAVIVDEYGGTDGIVTIEDIMEEIVGRIDDEHDIDTDDYKIVKPGVIIASARVEVETIENIIGLKLKREYDDFDTVGGLIIAKIGHVPEGGFVIDIESGVVIEVIEATPRAIKQIKITY